MFQMEDQQCPECTKIAHYHKTKQKKKNGFLLGTYECKGSPFIKKNVVSSIFLGRKDKKCGKIWKSAVAFKGSWQQCRRCDTKCHPVHVIGTFFDSKGSTKRSCRARLRRCHDNSIFKYLLWTCGRDSGREQQSAKLSNYKILWSVSNRIGSI